VAKVRAHIVVKGRVQGVFYRASTKDEAERLGINGWVKNRNDGSVEILAEGDELVVRELIEWCKKGPPHAKVKEVKVDWEEYKGEFKRFFITW
jgi:acylphosphatase